MKSISFDSLRTFWRVQLAVLLRTHHNSRTEIDEVWAEIRFFVYLGNRIVFRQKAGARWLMSLNSIMRSSYSKGIRDHGLPLELQRE